MTPRSVPHTQVEVEPLFAVPKPPDPLAAARAQRSRIAAARAECARTREAYLDAATELEQARSRGLTDDELHVYRKRMWNLHKPYSQASRELSDLTRKPARKRRRS